MNTIFWSGVGVMVGVGHAFGLWWGAHHPLDLGRGSVARLTLVSLVLVVAAWAKQLLPAAAGWGSGLAVASLLLYARRSG